MKSSQNIGGAVTILRPKKRARPHSRPPLLLLEPGFSGVGSPPRRWGRLYKPTGRGLERPSPILWCFVVCYPTNPAKHYTYSYEVCEVACCIGCARFRYNLCKERDSLLQQNRHTPRSTLLSLHAWEGRGRAIQLGKADLSTPTKPTATTKKN